MKLLWKMKCYFSLLDLVLDLVVNRICYFSSFGPSFDGRLKPEIVAQGLNTSLIGSTSGSVIAASGTSFSGPVMAGLLACLNGYESLSEQSETMNSNELLKMAVFKSSDVKIPLSIILETASNIFFELFITHLI